MLYEFMQNFPIWQLPLRRKYQGLVTPPDFICHKYGTINLLGFHRWQRRVEVQMVLERPHLHQMFESKESECNQEQIFQTKLGKHPQ